MREHGKFEPTILRYASMADLPPIDEIVRLAQTKLHLIVDVFATETIVEVGHPPHKYNNFWGEKYEAPDAAECEQFVQALTVRLPDFDCKTFGFHADERSRAAKRNVGTVLTGTLKIYMDFAISKQDKEKSLSLFLAAAAEYETLANTLMRRMARQLGVEISAFSETMREHPSWWDEEQIGVLAVTTDDPPTAEKWGWFFHGDDCGLRNRKGFIAEIRLGDGPECGQNFGTLRSDVLRDFIRTNERFAPLVHLLGDTHNNTGHFMEYAAQRGFLQRLSRRYILTDAGRDLAKTAATKL